MSSNKKIFDQHEDTVIANYIQRLGNSASIGLMHPLCKFFHTPSIDGVIGYRVEGKYLVVIGDPVCETQDRLALTEAFHEFCKAQNKKSMYVMTSESFTNEVLDCFDGSALQFGHEIIIDTTIDTRTLTGNYPHHLRQKHRHALLHGLTFFEYDGNNPEIEQALTTIAQEWLANRRGAQVHVLPLDVFSHKSSKRWFYAQKEECIVGFLMLNRIDAFQGWVLNGSMMLTAEAPTSTSEFLMISTLETLREEGYKCLSIGPTMSLEIDRIDGFGWVSRMLINYGMKSAHKIFRMHDHQRYWKKFQPRKEPMFLTFSSSRMGLQEIRAILRTFNMKI